MAEYCHSLFVQVIAFVGVSIISLIAQKTKAQTASHCLGRLSACRNVAASLCVSCLVKDSVARPVRFIITKSSSQEVAVLHKFPTGEFHLFKQACLVYCNKLFQ